MQTSTFHLLLILKRCHSLSLLQRPTSKYSGQLGNGQTNAPRVGYCDIMCQLWHFEEGDQLPFNTWFSYDTHYGQKIEPVGHEQHLSNDGIFLTNQWIHHHMALGQIALLSLDSR